ncbi:MAG TPA: serine hydrolase [Candidatus Acidoferrales bacterium]|nr:serine hydrolase [Candidatus Acidoferrales bacterium]
MAMRNRVAGVMIALVCLLGAAPTARAQGDSQWTSAQASSLDNFIDSAMHQWKVPGLAIGIVRGSSVVYLKGFGVRDIKTGERVTPDTLFDIGSCTKAFTAGSVAILVDRGKMRWDDRVIDYVPFFHLHDPMADEYVTMRDLLTHRTGMGGTDLLWYGSPFSLEEIIRRVRYIEPSAGFRARFQYQNVMYATAGYAVGEATGGTWENFVRQNIFEPLGMNGADFSATDAQKAANRATPHSERPNGTVETIPWRNLDNIAPAGSINSGVRDMTKWIAMQLNDGLADGKRLISEKSMREMHTPQIVVPQGGEFQLFFPKSMQLSYGMGWFIEDYRGHQVILHPGDIDGFASLVVLIPEVHTGFVIFANLDHTPVREGLAYHLIDQFLGLQAEDWIAHFDGVAKGFVAAEEKQTAEEEKKQRAETHPSRELAAYAGTYRNRAYGDVVVSLEGDHLALQFDTFKSVLTHYQYDTFVADFPGLGGKMRATFYLDGDGDVTKVSATGLEFERVNGNSRN